MPFKIFLISEDDMKGILEKHRGLTGEVTKALSRLRLILLILTRGIIKERRKEGARSKKAHVVEDAPVAKIPR